MGSSFSFLVFRRFVPFVRWEFIPGYQTVTLSVTKSMRKAAINRTSGHHTA